MNARKGMNLLIILILLGIQLIPVDRSNPPAQQPIPAPPEVADLLQKSCYDCHSHRTQWPWYSRIAPVSWLLANHVKEGRHKLNFSTWNQLSQEQQTVLLREIGKEVAEGEMPLPSYLIFHPDAKLNDGERAILLHWTGAQARAGS